MGFDFVFFVLFIFSETQRNMTRRYLAGAVSLSHHTKGLDHIYVLGDQHVRTATDLPMECPAILPGSILGIEKWIETFSGTDLEILLEVDPVLTRTMKLANSWIGNVQAELEGKHYSLHYVDVRGRALLSQFGDTKQGHRKINDFLTALYEAADRLFWGTKAEQKTAADRLQNITGLVWSEERIVKESVKYATLVDDHVKNLITKLVNQPKKKPITIIMFVGEAHAELYNEWLRSQGWKWKEEHEPVGNNDTLSKCIDITNVT